MSDRPDASLLEAWSAEGSEEAFAALARRYGGLLYHAALRRTGRNDLAGEAAQNSLLILARKAPRLGHLPCLSGWLHRTACYEAAKLLRREQRHQACMKQLPLPDGDEASPWQDIAPLLDQALDALPEKDREVIFLKYFDGLSFEQMARQFGGESAAWRQRGSRAIERLRRSLTERGVAVSSTALSSGLGTSLSQAAPTTFLSSLPSSAAATALSWKSLTPHSIHLMKLKPTAAIAAVLLLSFVPLGMQAMAISDARQRVALLESRLANSAHPAARQAVASNRAGAPMNLVALADALLAARDGDFVKKFTTGRKVDAMSVDELERLLLESTSIELGPEQRSALVQALFRQFCRDAQKSGISCERVVSLGMRLASSMSSQQGTIWNIAGSNLRQWVEQNPDEAVAWYRGRDTSLQLAEAGIVAAHAFDGLHRRNPEEAAAFFRSLGDKERQTVIGGGGGWEHPELMVGLAAEIGDDGIRALALTQVFRTAAGRSPQEVRGWIDRFEPARKDASQLIAAAAGRFTSEMPVEEAVKKIDWVREAAAGLDPSEAAGVYLDGVLHSAADRVKEVLDAAWQRHSDERMLATYISRCMFNEELILDAVQRSRLVQDTGLRDPALYMMLCSNRSDEKARALGRKGGLSEEEINRIIPREP